MNSGMCCYGNNNTLYLLFTTHNSQFEAYLRGGTALNVRMDGSRAHFGTGGAYPVAN